MRANRASDTSPELRLRKALHAKGFRYVLGSRLPGKPDLVFPSRRIVVFVDGCFWHGCPVHMVTPQTNTEKWIDKISSNKARDRKVDIELSNIGWRVIRVWEHDVKSNLTSIVQRLCEELCALHR